MPRGQRVGGEWISTAQCGQLQSCPLHYDLGNGDFRGVVGTGEQTQCRLRLPQMALQTERSGRGGWAPGGRG